MISGIVAVKLSNEENTSKIPLVHQYDFMFPFEKSFDCQEAKIWMMKHWTDSFFYSIGYIVIIFTLKHLMKNRAPFKLRKLLIAWNSILAAFSIMGALRLFPQFIHGLKNFGFHHSVCNPHAMSESKVAAFWMFLFSLSKLPELVDTLFVVLRKQKLIFLHWYHHCTVFSMAWYSYAFFYSPGQWYSIMNYFVHSLMYSYFACRALKVRLPKLLAMFITSSQILQMAIGFYVTLYAFLHSDNCHAQKSGSFFGLLMYGSYFILFIEFFVSVYLKGEKSAKASESNEKSRVKEDKKVK